MLCRLLSLFLAVVVTTPLHAAELRGWSLHAADYPVVQGMSHFASQIAAKTGGKYSAKVFPQASLGDQNKAVAMLASGEIDFAVINNTPLSKAHPPMEVLSLPFLFQHSRHMLKVMDGPIGDELAKGLEAKGFIVLGWYDGGARSFYTRGKAVLHASDYAGLRFRVADNKLFKDMITALGATPVVIPFKDVVAGFESGQIDGAENNLPSFESEDHYKHARNYTFTNHIVLPEALVISPVLWKKLSAAEKQAFREVGHESALLMRERWNARVQAIRGKLEKEGVRFAEIGDHGPYVSRMREIYRPYMDNQATGSLVLRIMTSSSR